MTVLYILTRSKDLLIQHFPDIRKKMNINIEEVNCFYMCHMISESFKKDLNGAYDLVAARDTKKRT